MTNKADQPAGNFEDRPEAHRVRHPEAPSLLAAIILLQNRLDEIFYLMNSEAKTQPRREKGGEQS